ncbi:hypothetical protein [Demequina lignilytica]|uniref:Uncharacterized protein n=1 Tax=Demequina lignilytica TaxID=3051663 RepID=A0AB35MF13_9MICO|nr:hypothetical protein [Demequina sp. SYSU T0a273]MDN4482368.1 hypothetical protein [Demequina sp. SYSU T0a273]
MTLARHLIAAAGAGVTALALAACSGAPAVELPDLTSLGLSAVDCAETAQMADVVASPPAGSETACWTGAPDDGFVATADAILALLMEDAGEEGTDATSALCWDDALTETEGSACRAVVVGDLTDGTVVSAVIAVTDPASMTADLPDDATEEQVAEAIAGAPIEVLLFSEPASLVDA